MIVSVVVGIIFGFELIKILIIFFITEKNRNSTQPTIFPICFYNEKKTVKNGNFTQPTVFPVCFYGKKWEFDRETCFLVPAKFTLKNSKGKYGRAGYNSCLFCLLSHIRKSYGKFRSLLVYICLFLKNLKLNLDCYRLKK